MGFYPFCIRMQNSLKTTKKIILFSFVFLSFAAKASSDEKKDNDILLNAESASMPREINIGLPDSGNGAVVFVDGCKHAFGLPRGQFHCAGGNAYERIGTISLMESVIRVGEIGVLVDSYTKTGGDFIDGVVTLGTSINGKMLLDACSGGPMRKGSNWTYSLGVYINYDPTSINAPGRRFVEQKQIYQLSLTRRRKDSKLSFIYRLSFSGDNIGEAYNVAPFIYNGDGSVSKFGQFRPGSDCYFPEDDHIRYMDVADGTFHSGHLGEMDKVTIHDFSMVYSHNLPGGWMLKSNSHICFMPSSTFARTSLAGIDKVGIADGFTTSSGTQFSGMAQKRISILENERTCDIESDNMLEKSFARHKLKAGLNLVFCDQYEAGSSFSFAHTVNASPARLYKDGAETWGLNTNSLYFDALRFCPTLYLFDDIQLSPSTVVTAGLRAKGSFQNINTAARLDGQTKNARVDGFNIADKALCELNHFNSRGLDYAASLHLTQKIHDGWFAMAEGFYSMTNKTSTYYRNATIPSLKPIGNAMARAGAVLDYGKKLNASLMFSYITCWNCAAVLNVTGQTSSGSVTIPWTAEYGIGTPGITLDINTGAKRFNLHGMLTFQNPVYLDYRNSFNFGDGKATVLDYTGNTCTGISKLIIEARPSYSGDKFNIWLSLRYFSKQYVSRTNLACFNGHFETFGGVEWKINKNTSLSLDLVNVLFQDGMKGSVSIADTITDVSLLNNYLMAGTYIRPFSIDLKYTFRFNNIR